jgi:hypothetical protein
VSRRSRPRTRPGRCGCCGPGRRPSREAPPGCPAWRRRHIRRLARTPPGPAPTGPLLADRHLHRCYPLAEGLLELVEGALERRPVAIELADDDRPGNALLGGSPPHQLGRYLDAVDGGDDEQGEVGGAQGGAGVAREVGIPGSVDQVDGVAVPLEGGDGQAEGDLALDLLRLVVEQGGPLVDRAEPVGGPAT